jgi:hypothetical protein
MVDLDTKGLDFDMDGMLTWGNDKSPALPLPAMPATTRNIGGEDVSSFESLNAGTGFRFNVLGEDGPPSLCGFSTLPAAGPVADTMAGTPSQDPLQLVDPDRTLEYREVGAATHEPVGIAAPLSQQLEASKLGDYLDDGLDAIKINLETKFSSSSSSSMAFEPTPASKDLSQQTCEFSEASIPMNREEKAGLPASGPTAVSPAPFVNSYPQQQQQEDKQASLTLLEKHPELVDSNLAPSTSASTDVNATAIAATAIAMPDTPKPTEVAGGAAGDHAKIAGREDGMSDTMPSMTTENAGHLGGLATEPAGEHPTATNTAVAVTTAEAAAHEIAAPKTAAPAAAVLETVAPKTTAPETTKPEPATTSAKVAAAELHAPPPSRKEADTHFNLEKPTAAVTMVGRKFGRVEQVFLFSLSFSLSSSSLPLPIHSTPPPPPLPPFPFYTPLCASPLILYTSPSLILYTSPSRLLHSVHPSLFPLHILFTPASLPPYPLPTLSPSTRIHTPLVYIYIYIYIYIYMCVCVCVYVLCILYIYYTTLYNYNYICIYIYIHIYIYIYA